jgi:hypothetical protein
MARRRQRKKIKKNEYKLYLSITIVCLILAAVLNFLVKCGAETEDNIRLITGTEPEAESVIKLMNTYEGKTDVQLGDKKNFNVNSLSKQEIEKLKNDYKGKIDPSQFDKYKDMLKKYQEGKE